MKITAVIGSPSRNGNTAVLARAALEAARSEGADTEEIVLSEHHIEYCRGCMNCMRTGTCLIEDEAFALRDKLYASDGIILASPSYGIQMTARMKNFLVDRIGMFTVYTSSFGGKYFVGISTAGGIGAKKVARTLAEEYAAGFFRRGYISGSLGILRGHGRVEDVPGALEQSRALGRRLASDIEEGQTYPFQCLGRRLITRFVVRPMILKNIRQNKDGTLKAVWETIMSL